MATMTPLDPATGAAGGKGKKSKKKDKAPSSVRVTLSRLFPTVVKAPENAPVATQAMARARLPRVNMLPPSRMLEVRKRALIRRFVLAGVVLVVASAAVWFIQGTAITIASSSAETAQTQMQASLNRVKDLKPIGTYFDNLQTRLNIGAAAYMEQADYSAVLDGLMAVAPEGVTVASVTLDFVPITDDSPPSCGQEGSPFAEVETRALGCVSFSGYAADREALTEFIRSLDTVKGLQVPFVVPGEDTTEGQIMFSGTAGISATANLAGSAAQIIDVEGIEGITPADPNALTPGAKPSASANPDGAGAGE